MNRKIRISSLVFFSLGSALAQTATTRIVSAANSFLATLNQQRRQRVLFSFNDENQRKGWSNLPVGIVPRAGLSMGELSASQRSAALAVVSSALSKRGYESG